MGRTSRISVRCDCWSKKRFEASGRLNLTLRNTIYFSNHTFKSLPHSFRIRSCKVAVTWKLFRAQQQVVAVRGGTSAVAGWCAGCGCNVVQLNECAEIGGNQRRSCVFFYLPGMNLNGSSSLLGRSVTVCWLFELVRLFDNFRRVTPLVG